MHNLISFLFVRLLWLIFVQGDGPVASRHEFDRDTGSHVGGHEEQESMPDHEKIVCSAGSVMAFDTRCAHTAFANTSSETYTQYSNDCVTIAMNILVHSSIHIWLASKR